MNFLIFRDFFPDFSELILIFNVKYNLKKSKKRVLFVRGHVDATWHVGPRGSATQARVSANVAHR